MPETSQDLLHYLSNDVFRAIRRGWYRHEHGDGRNATFRVLGTGTYSEPDIRWEAAKGLSEPHAALSIHRPHAILIDKTLHDNLLYELPEDQEHAWLDATESNIRINTLWYRNEAKGSSYWRPNPNLPGSVPITGLRLTKRLLEARLIWQCTPEQAAQLQADREDAVRALSAPEIIEQAAEAASCE